MAVDDEANRRSGADDEPALCSRIQPSALQSKRPYPGAGCVGSRDGVVTLAGSVGSASERDKAVQIARNTEGVTDVHEQLQVGRGEAGTSCKIASRF
jgi:hyperosmotically inducible protein